MRLPIVVSIPHGGWKVAEEVEPIWALTEEEAFHDGDPLTARIYDFSDRAPDSPPAPTTGRRCPSPNA